MSKIERLRIENELLDTENKALAQILFGRMRRKEKLEPWEQDRTTNITQDENIYCEVAQVG